MQTLQTKPEYIKIFTPDFRYSQNGSTPIDAAELIQRGSYNVLINDSSYTAQSFDFEASHDAFKEVGRAGKRGDDGTGGSHAIVRTASCFLAQARSNSSAVRSGC